MWVNQNLCANSWLGRDSTKQLWFGCLIYALSKQSRHFQYLIPSPQDLLHVHRLLPLHRSGWRKKKMQKDHDTGQLAYLWMHWKLHWHFLVLFYLNCWTSWVNVHAAMFYLGKVTRKRIIPWKSRISISYIPWKAYQMNRFNFPSHF